MRIAIRPKRWQLLAGAVAMLVAVATLLILFVPTGSAETPKASFEEEFPHLFGTGTLTPTPAQRASLQEEALRGCRCERRFPHGDPRRESCWTRFYRELEPFDYSTASTMCMPTSTEEVCFGDDCIVKSYGSGACTAEEARIIDSIWAETAGEDQASWDRAGDRIGEAVQAFIRGERLTAPASPVGCAG